MGNKVSSIKGRRLLEMSAIEFLDVVATEMKEMEEKGKSSYKAFESTYSNFQRQYQDYCRLYLDKNEKKELLFGKPYKTNTRV